LLIIGNHVSPEIKDISVYQNGKLGHIFAHPVLVRRASAVVTDVGRVAVDADVTETTVAEAYGKSVWSRRRRGGVKFLKGQR